MTALAGVNGGSSQESVNPALTQVEPMATELLEAEPAEPGAAEAEPAETVAEPAETVAEPAESAEVAKAEAEPGQAGVTEPELAGTGVAEAGHGGGERGEAKPTRDIKPLAIVGMVLGVIALVGVAAGVLDLATHGFHRKTVVTYRPAAVFTLRPGDCVNSAPNGLAFTRLACSEPHDAEVFATFALPGSSWPGSAAVQQEAGNACADRISGYLNPQLADAAFAQEYIYPDQSAWLAGEHTVVCEIRSSTGKLTGSVRKVS